MKVYEMMNLGRSVLETLHRSGSKVSDYEWLALYFDYVRMKAEGMKVGYIVEVLKEKYHVCERKVYKVVRMMEREC